MRLVGFLIAALALYAGVPRLREHAVVAGVNELSKVAPSLPRSAAIPSLDPNLINAISPAIEINTEDMNE